MLEHNKVFVESGSSFRYLLKTYSTGKVAPMHSQKGAKQGYYSSESKYKPHFTAAIMQKHKNKT